MKLALNGALTVGTLDGANIEIAEAVGSDNIFIFGLTAEQVATTREAGYDPAAHIAAEPRLAEVLEQISSGVFSPDDPDRFAGLVANLRESDWFMVAADFSAYWDIQQKIDGAWRKHDDWIRSAVLNTAHMGWFSSDRTIRGYARDIWNATPAF
jgi:starch phosphorylase